MKEISYIVVFINVSWQHLQSNASARFLSIGHYSQAKAEAGFSSSTAMAVQQFHEFLAELLCSYNYICDMSSGLHCDGTVIENAQKEIACSVSSDKNTSQKNGNTLGTDLSEPRKAGRMSTGAAQKIVISLKSQGFFCN